MRLLRSPDELHRLIAANAREDWKPSFDDCAKWLAEPSHFALVEGNDLGMFDAKGEWPGPLYGHVFFASRGKQALTVARAMLEQAFAFGATEIFGRTPAKFRDTMLFIRLLGFRPYGEDSDGDEKVILSRLSHKYCEPESVA